MIMKRKGEAQLNGVSAAGASDAPSSSSSVCGGCARKLRSCIPVNYKEEIRELLKLAGPVFISQLMIFMISFVSTVFCGHLGKTELAGVALAIAVVNVTGLCVGAGLASACDTLISQTFGSNNLKRVGVILQRGVLILLLACFPCWAVLINTESILLAVRQSPGVASGSAMANSISQFALAVFLYVYIHLKGLHKATWDGWSRDCLQEWGPYFRLALPSMLMLCVEWWTYEIGGFLAGLISEAELGAQSIVYELATIAYMGITGGIVRGAGKQLLGAGCILVGYYLVGFPIGVSLMFALKMGIVGLWSGLFVCVFLQSLFFLILIYKLDWNRATEEALKRAGVQRAEAKTESYALENKCVDIDVRQESQPREGEQTDVEAKGENDEERAAEDRVAVTVGDVLTTKQLVVRRGLAVFLMILILAAGITLNEILTGLLR
ncbi:hypothetical protein QTP70_002466 [Hemibagrus guttatus]|uniref:Multidrug and toxin extrusion protein n=1 Tax=Hemibagrus guttatus TaxID=175788 RepID=A0AAE0QI45_9TELE|nr:hypothetical protein QTP70_002466 [Hemibagrus guttatus]